MDSTSKKNQTKSPSLDQNRLKILCDQLSDRVEDLFKFFEIEYSINDKYATFCCPIHDGDNTSALNLYYVGDTYKGNWKCRTHHCEKIFMASIIGFVRGVLSKNKLNWRKRGDDMVSFNDTIKFIIDFLNIKDLRTLDSENNPNLSFVKTTTILRPNSKSVKGIPRSKVKEFLHIPSQYFINRGFSKDILIKYDVGDCSTPNKEMYGRAVVPIYDHDY